MSDKIETRTGRRQAQNDQKRGKKPGKKKGWFKKIILAIVILGFAGLLAGGGLFAFYASTAPKLEEELLRDPLSSELLYANKESMYKTGAEKREYVNYNDIPKMMEQAILATEDVRFYQHKGMDFYRLGGAVLANFKRGFGSEGASTLSQQVIKNSFLSTEKTLKRKAQEAWLAFQLERQYDKEEIFEMYFNKVLMSSNQYGFGTAAQYFYGKELNELELHEMAMLAGLPQSPNGYNPYTNPERAEKRRNIVLKLMHQHEKITKSEMEAAQKIDVTSTLLPEEQRKANSFKYPALLDVVMNELEEAGYGDIIDEGVTIHTTFDPVAQQIVEEEINNGQIYIDDEIQSALTVLDTKTGGMVAIGAGRNYTTGLNYARQEKRQLGSTIKPLLSYGPAIEYLSMSTGQMIVDDKYTYQDGKGKVVNNVDNRYLGPMSIREALYNSRNVPAVKLFEEVGRTRATEFAGKLGIQLNDENPSNALGGTKQDFSTIELAGAYAAFGNKGVYTTPYSITKIVTRDGQEIDLRPKQTIAMKESTAYMVTDMLRDVFTKGTGKRANVSGLDMAGKTGTTNNALDSWFAGYTTDYTIAGWSGYKDRRPMTQMEQQRYIPQDLYREVMRRISTGRNTASFSMPSSVEKAEVVYLSNPLVRASAATPSSMKRTELFVKGEVPTEVVEEDNEFTLSAPENLTATYDEVAQSVTLNWNYEMPDPEEWDLPIEFTVSGSADGGAQVEITTTGDLSVTMTNVEMNRTYTFYVVAKSGELKSNAASVSLKVEGAEDDDEPEEPVEPEEPETPDDNGDEDNNEGNNDGNSNDPSNNNQSGNQNDNNSNNNNNNDSNEGNREDDNPDGTDGEN